MKRTITANRLSAGFSLQFSLCLFVLTLYFPFTLDKSWKKNINECKAFIFFVKAGKAGEKMHVNTIKANTENKASELWILKHRSVYTLPHEMDLLKALCSGMEKLMIDERIELHMDQLSVGQLAVCRWPRWLSGPSRVEQLESSDLGESEWEKQS